MTMTKADIVQTVYHRLGLSKKESADVVESVFELIRSQLESGEPVKISGFGGFSIRDKKPRQGRNPKTGEDVEISARRVVTFKASQILLDRVNKGPS
ncbi:integration host factor, alpha subunit [Magnetococcus marinus MC-1]|uniref:Integration host factor subunit alpha n=1 Tax=Magnetococcus marinus (strain ATCC BAA-1437 / JCM 17883 / MC-1) TaxID=156889 RepID=A0L776_MAGMM|nr:integration host factor subunit alpha [Magnetococcus marinus]ABK43819.1 integration host factor, alpha subunit [Magnetococcus marinus MC-1]ABK45330.1 integration host factor, alpha subunit [Magnetococcus marinus MC-1]